MRNKLMIVLCGLAVSLAGCDPKGGGGGEAAPETLMPFRTAEGKWGFKKGSRTVIDAKFDNVMQFKDGIARVKLNGKYGFIDEVGETLIEAKYEDAGRFGDGVAPVKSDGKFGFVDRNGKIVLEAKYDRADSFSGGYAIVNLEGKNGHIDKDGVFKEGDPPGSGESDGGLESGEGMEDDGGN